MARMGKMTRSDSDTPVFAVSHRCNRAGVAAAGHETRYEPGLQED